MLERNVRPNQASRKNQNQNRKFRMSIAPEANRPLWPVNWWLVSFVHMSLMIVSYPRQSECMSAMTPPYNGSAFDHEGLLVDLLNKQQGEFLARMQVSGHSTRTSQQEGEAAAQPSSVWNQLNQGKFVPITISGEMPTSSLIAPHQQSRTAPGPAESINSNARHDIDSSLKSKPSEPCDRKRQTRTLPKQDNNVTSTSPSTKDGSIVKGAEDEREEDTDDEDNDDDEADEMKQGSTKENNTTASRASSGDGDLLDGRESISRGSSIEPPLQQGADSDQYSPSDGRQSGGGAGEDEDDEPEAEQQPHESSQGKQEEVPDAEAAERREQEAAEASEAEAADRSALAEQQQAQREIILAQAQSEAKAIREQQEALLKQQQLQQQMLMRRHQNFLDDESKSQQRDRHQRQNERQLQQKNEPGRPRGFQRPQSRLRTAQSLNQQQQVRRQHPGQHQRSEMDSQGRRATDDERREYGELNQVDNQFSDQPDNGVVDRGTGSSTKPVMLNDRRQQRQQQQQQQQQQQIQREAEDQSADELGNGEDSINRPRLAKEEPPATPGSSLKNAMDLATAAQHHHYGIYYGSLDGHLGGGFGGYVDGGHKKKSGGYHQYANSHKKGQYDSGFKRGNKKFVISGHSSQHKSHAQGHVKWNAKKGKGSHTWDYKHKDKHKNKKHYGTGYGYGGGHHYY